MLKIIRIGQSAAKNKANIVKECTKCHNSLEVNLKNFYQVKQRKDGFDDLCRSCRNSYHREQKAKTQGLSRKVARDKAEARESAETHCECKTCLKSLEKNLDNFYENPKTKDGLSKVCRECRNARLRMKNKDPENRQKTRERIQVKKVKLVMYKGSTCHHCEVPYTGSNACIFDFHHTDEGTKEFTISGSMYKSMDALKAEADKCILLCSNCHREVHSMPY